MTPRERHQRLMALFDLVCDLPPQTRAERLDALCGGDAELRNALERMLEQDARVSQEETRYDRPNAPTVHAANRLAHALLEVATPSAWGTPHDGTHPETGAGEETPLPNAVGPFRIVGRIGRGGMGTVYEALQEAPRRRVALKIVHPWLLSSEVVQRFRFEADALAQLLHPGIPQVYAVGEEGGRVYFAMELVSGRMLMDHLRAHALPLRARIELLAQVCDAVHHAHLRGFLHRDLKPENIRVAESGQPKVLDFGIATALADDVRPESALSGTLAYMSPEQLDGAPLDVRSDVFSLGLIGFELFSGRRARELSGLSFPEALRKAREVPIPALASALPGAPAELCAIIDRTVSQRPDDRYASAYDLALELRRFLRGDAVEAMPQTVRYRARVFLRQHRVLVTASAVTGLALLAGGVSAFLSYRRAAAAHRSEVVQRERAEATLDFFNGLLLEAHPNQAVGQEVTIREALDRASARLDSGALRDAAAVEASVRKTLADTYLGLGHIAEAGAQLRAAGALLEDRRFAGDEIVARVLSARADFELHHGSLEAAESFAARAVAMERRFHPDSVELTEALHAHAEVLRELGRMTESEAAYREALRIREALHARGALPLEEVTGTMNQLAYGLAITGRTDEARTLYETAFERDRARWGDGHPEIATDLHHLAWFDWQHGNPRAAWEKLRRAREIRVPALGPDHPRLGVQHVLEASVQLDLGNVEEAAKLADRGLEILAAHEGRNSTFFHRYALVKARVLLASGDVRKARALTEPAVAHLCQRFGERRWRAAEARALMGEILIAEGDREAGERLLHAAAADLRAQLGPDSPLLRTATR